MTTPLVCYYECKATTARNAEYPIHVLMAGNLDWPENVLKQRGLLGNRKLTRPMDADELACRDKATRAKSYRYRTLQGLVEDEERCGQSPEFIAALRHSFAHLPH